MEATQKARTELKIKGFCSFRAFCTASIHFFRGLLANAFFAFAEAPLLTTLPLLFLRSELFVKPPTVFSFLPLKPADLANLPLPILLTFMTFFFIDFFAFIAFEAFMAAFF